MRQALANALRLRCPHCGDGKLFDGLIAMHGECPQCHMQFEREPGYFIGAIYINYALTVGLALSGFFALEYFAALTLRVQLPIWVVFCGVFPVFSFRFSKSLWLAVDYLINPEPPPLRRVR